MTETAVATSSSSIVLVTEIPGPRSRALWARREKATPRGLAHTAPIFIDRAEGALLHDVDGNVLIDFAGGIGTLNFGHTNPAVVDAVREQVGKLTHTCFTVVGYEPYLLLAERLNALVPGAFEKKTMLANSGAEAVENAVKIARHATGRQGVLVFEHGFHGRTLLGLSMTSKVKPYKVGFGPYAPEIYRMPFPYEYRREAPCTSAAYEREIREFFASYVAPEQVACVVMELVTGEGGFIPAPPAFVEALYRVCRGNGILFVDDEIQTGFGRTGKMFACEHYSELFDFAPDLVITAKSLGGGLPISAVTGRAEIMDSPQVGGLGGTYLGNPVACAAALAILDQVEKEGMVERARRLGAKVETRFAELASRYSRIGDARGLGAMRALEFVKDRVTKEPDKEFTQRVIQNAYKSGLLLLSAGTAGNIIRTLMPFVITDDQLDEGMALLERVIASA